MLKYFRTYRYVSRFSLLEFFRKIKTVFDNIYRKKQGVGGPKSRYTVPLILYVLYSSGFHMHQILYSILNVCA